MFCWEDTQLCMQQDYFKLLKCKDFVDHMNIWLETLFVLYDTVNKLYCVLYVCTSEQDKLRCSRQQPWAAAAGFSVLRGSRQTWGEQAKTQK